MEKVIVTCPICSKQREVAVFAVKRKSFTGRCDYCNRKILGKIVGLNTDKRGKNSPRWKGGRQKNHSGYIFATITPEDDFFLPMTHPSSNRVMEHRLVMAKHLSRCLLPWEVVHHKNGIRDDNRIENLTLLPDKRWHIIDNKTKGYIGILLKQIEAQGNRIKELEGKNETTNGN